MNNEETNIKEAMYKYSDQIDSAIESIESLIDLAIMQGYQNEQWFLNALDRLNKVSLKNLNIQSTRV